MPAHPISGAPVSLTVDRSNYAIGAVLQQRANDEWQPLWFITKSLTPAQRKYSAYDRVLLTMYTAVKRFRHAVEGRNFAIYADHKPLTYAFNQNLGECSPRQFRYLDYIHQFTTDTGHIKSRQRCSRRSVTHRSDRKVCRSPNARRRVRKWHQATRISQIRYIRVTPKKDTFSRSRRRNILRRIGRHRTTKSVPKSLRRSVFNSWTFPTWTFPSRDTRHAKTGDDAFRLVFDKQGLPKLDTTMYLVSTPSTYPHPSEHLES